MRPCTTSPGNMGRGQPNSVPPGEPFEVDLERTLSKNARIHSDAEYHPDAHRPPKTELRPASSSMWNGCGS